MNKMQVKIEKVSNNENKFRGDFTGEAIALPEVGKSFSVVGRPLDEVHDFRQLTTSVVKEIIDEANNVKLLKTLNSSYRVTFLNETDC